MHMDFIEHGASAYRFVVQQHRIIYHMALIPFVVKLLGFILITILDINDNYLRQGLILFPSYLLEGWLIAKLIRFAVLGELLTLLPEETDKKQRLISMKGAMIIYVLIKMVMAFTAGSLMNAQEIVSTMETQNTDPSAIGFFSAVAAVVFLIWSFRLIWIYIPVALGHSASEFLLRIRAFSSSISMFGTWLICFVPIAILMLMISQLLLSIFGGDIDSPSVVFEYTIIVMQAFFELFIAMVSSLAMAFWVASVYKKY